MAFDPKIVEARISLGLVSSTDVPKLAWDALEAGFDGPAIRRAAALQFPTYFEVQPLLPSLKKEMGLEELSIEDAARRLARIRAREIVQSGSDPLQHLSDFEQLWLASNYSPDLSEYGTLADDAYIAKIQGKSEPEIRAWAASVIRRLALDEV